MPDLRSELGVAPPPARYRILCPPGWRRVSPEELIGEEATSRFRAEAARAGRTDLLRELDTMLDSARTALRTHGVTEVYVAPSDEEGVRPPATLSVAPLALPAGTTLEQALARIARGRPVIELEGARERLHVIEHERRHGDADELVERTLLAIAPVPASDDRRAIVLTFTALGATRGGSAGAAEAEEEDAIETLLDIGRIMLVTFRWSPS
ncbi:hypothetical protein [Yonghaparkia sp. Root332]|uniref:hypothetical protein n=1 Tax=Yonghaparkia sp. Root332 TaxID=1736516 RepID=UPI0006FA3FF3|nr:hypothetical protein [Yonghaparkia sp. Root332]KQV26093.1 hypothetical protein ASC54_03935 [Yonghaparkia sp. Root332]